MPSAYKSRTSITNRTVLFRRERGYSEQPAEWTEFGTLSVYENKAVGTVVGEFNATDPDAGVVLTYHLVSGVGDGNNSSLIWRPTARSVRSL